MVEYAGPSAATSTPTTDSFRSYAAPRSELALQLRPRPAT
jgi:hypothetical protein